MHYLDLMSPRLPALLLALALAACEGKDGLLSDHMSDASSTGEASADPPVTTGDSTTDGSTSDGSTSDDSTSAEPPQLCPCVVDDPGEGQEDPSLPTCAESICPLVAASYAQYCEGMCIEGAVVDAAALECALVALRDRTPGLIRWRLAIEGELYYGNGYLWIRDDGTAVWRKWENEDLSYDVSPAQIVALPAGATYEQCLAADDATAFECVRQALAGPDDLVCDEGWHADAI